MLRLAGLVAVTLCGALAATAFAQSSSDPCKTEGKRDPDSYATIRLVNMTQQRDANEVQTDLRNMLPCARIYYVPSQNALSLSASAANMEEARKIVVELDQPRKSYRVTFTLVQVEAGKRMGARKFSLVLWANERTTLKQGQRIPITTGADKKESVTAVQVQYVDVGLNLQASIEGNRLSTKVEESAVVPSAAAANPEEPSIAQTVLEGSSLLKIGSPLVIGSLELPGSTHRQDVEVLVEAID
jgi:type II secretory pathway component GspD/PulD (secretin)